MAGSQIVDAPRKSVFTLSPDAVLIDGLDEGTPPANFYNEMRLKEPILDEDVLSIIESGVLKDVAIEVKKAADGTKAYHVRDGIQRTRRTRVANEWIQNHNSGANVLPQFAGRVLELRALTCTVVKLEDEIASVLYSITANTGTAADTPRRLALTAQWLATQGLSHERIALSLGKGIETIRSYCKLENASAKVMKAFDEGRLPITAVAKAASGLSKKEQDEWLDDYTAKHGEGSKITKESAMAATRGKKAEAKGKTAAGEAMTKTQIKHTLAGLEAELAETDGRSAEARTLRAMIATVNAILGEGTHACDEDKVLNKTFHAAARRGQKDAEKAKKEAA